MGPGAPLLLARAHEMAPARSKFWLRVRLLDRLGERRASCHFCPAPAPSAAKPAQSQVRRPLIRPERAAATAAVGAGQEIRRATFKCSACSFGSKLALGSRPPNPCAMEFVRAGRRRAGATWPTPSLIKIAPASPADFSPDAKSRGGQRVGRQRPSGARHLNSARRGRGGGAFCSRPPRSKSSHLIAPRAPACKSRKFDTIKPAWSRFLRLAWGGLFRPLSSRPVSSPAAARRVRRQRQQSAPTHSR